MNLLTLKKLALVGGAMLTLLWLNWPLRTLADEPEEGPCHLAQSQNCDFDALTGSVNMSNLYLKTNPALGARGVPTYTLVSITFNQEIDAATLNKNTFYVNQDNHRLTGTLEYITVSRVAVFYPEAPLQPNTTYTATVTTGVKNRAGEPLAAAVVWSFTTWPQPFTIPGDVAAAGGVPMGNMYIYFGDLHSHSGYSDGQGTPAQAFQTARATGLDFLALTDHDIMLTEAEWQDVLTQANTATLDGVFVGLRGFEFTHNRGHINVFNTDTFVRGDDLTYQHFNNFYNWLLAQPAALGQFNHPLTGENFDNFAYYPQADQVMRLRELSTVNQFLLSLNVGWHSGTLRGSDTHSANWGLQRFTGVVAPGLTKTLLLDSLRARRTFFVSPNGQNLAVVMQANGAWMGSAIPNTGIINFTITVYDPNAAGQPYYVNLYRNGTWITGAALPGAVWASWQPSVQATPGHYYYVEAYHSGWQYAAYSSPIWVEQPPVARPGPAQTVAPGRTVTLNGSGSWDPDGDALAYHWIQTGGPAVNLNQNDAAQVTFVTPAELGQAVFALTVTDPGNLIHTSPTMVTITDRPILALTKSGPATATPGELITYTLTVTNSGLAPATGLVITDAVPSGANYVSGGTWLPGGTVSWTLPSLAANDATTQVTFIVTTTGAIVNRNYRVSCAEGMSATGPLPILTNWQLYYLPIMMKNR